MEMYDSSRYLFLLGFFLILIVMKATVHMIRSPLRDIPGPFLARFTRLWELYIAIKTDYTQFNIELHKQYGTVPLQADPDAPGYSLTNRQRTCCTLSPEPL